MRSTSRRTRLQLGLVGALALLATACDLAAIPGDGPTRFRDEVFSGVTVTNNVQYGSAISQTGVATVLRYDLYQPSGDTSTARPLIIWIHGGSFAGGNENSPELVDQANVFARKGYVNASISYRLSAQGCTVVNAACVESIADAIEDAQAAVRYFRAHAAELRIDPDRIAVAGTSAGAITAMNVAFGTPAAETSGTPGVPDDVQAGISLSGGVIFTNNIDPTDARTLLFHGTADNVTPYSWAEATVAEAKADGLASYLISWEGAGHVPYVQHRGQIIGLSTNFLYHSLELGG
jgi:para-nitrobenzyl esterase